MSATKRRYERDHLKLDAPPVAPIEPTILHHPCGQPLRVEDTTVGYCTWFTFWVEDRGYRNCPRCGKRIRYLLLRPPRTYSDDGAFFEAAFEDHRDTMASLRATWTA